tara:strand:- start:56 stop:979 length:924 start_codon:yes stop_codon:yes gene_type:complete
MISESINNQRKAHQVLIENKLSFAGEGSELSIYDTFEQASNIKLASDQLMFCGMLSGKKIMHNHRRDFETNFLPHESFVMAPNRSIEIDFPTASITSPTTCIAIEISQKRIKRICNELNSSAPLSVYEQEWRYDDKLMHTHHNAQTQVLLNRMIHIFTENHQDRHFMVDLAVSELITRLLRHQTRDFILSHSLLDPEHNGINSVVAHLQQNLKEAINIDSLSKISCMSRTKFFSEFKRIIGCTPQDFLFQLRLKKAADLLKRNKSVTQVCFATGYLNTSHFSRSFKKFFGMNPSEYKLRHCSPLLSS